MTSRAPPETSASLGAGLRWLLYLVALGLWLSGAAWLVFHYFLQSQGEFGPAPNPLEHWQLVAHGFFAFAALFLFGLLWGRHIERAWKNGWRRPSGLFLAALTILLIASGYLLYYAGGDQTRATASLIHSAIGLAAPLLFFLHRFKKRTPRR